ncbi:cupin domain-containing protein [Nocardia brevicatena]|uniref:cupin domain-containing protein n=1 Tax=Nocardia brevicatena TaxID=37327 RepID=UPI0005943F6F|nr:cupin domain-containing protein [Nocardia brevicatena]
MTDGLLLPPGGGAEVRPAMTMKVGAEHSDTWSVFETVVPPGFDVGAHWHGQAEEFFYVLDGELDLLAFHPTAQTTGDWRKWEARDGTTVLRGGPGSFLHVPAGCPHAFCNPGNEPARMLVTVSPSGHEKYLKELAELLASGSSTPDDVVQLRLRYDIHQMTPLRDPTVNPGAQ